MFRFKPFLFLIVSFLLAAGVLLLKSGNMKVQAEPALTPTLNPIAWNYLPAAFGFEQGPTIRPTLTASPTLTSTPTSTATNTPEPGQLGAPIVFDIEDADSEGNFMVEWSAVSGADEYLLRESFNDVPPNDSIIYRGPNTSFSRSNMAEGRYCYRVRGIILGGLWGPWSEHKCIDVELAVNTPTPTLTSRPTLTPTPTPTSTPEYELQPPSNFEIGIEYEHYGNPYEQSEWNSGALYITSSWRSNYVYDYRLEKSYDSGNTWSFVDVQRGLSSHDLHNLIPGMWCLRVRAEIEGGDVATSRWEEKCISLYAMQCPPDIQEAQYGPGYLYITWEHSCPNADLSRFDIYVDSPHIYSQYDFKFAGTTDSDGTFFDQYGYKQDGDWVYRVCAFGYPNGSGYSCSDIDITVEN